MKYSSKSAFWDDSQREWETLWQLLKPFSTHDMERRLGDGESARSIVDHLAHVYAWHRLLLAWLKTGPNGQPDLPAKGYRWNQTRPLNQYLFEELKDESSASICRRLKRSHGRVFKFVDDLSEAQLLQAGHFVWTGKLGLISYIAPNTAGHYRWASKKIKRILNERNDE